MDKDSFVILISALTCIAIIAIIMFGMVYSEQKQLEACKMLPVEKREQCVKEAK